MEGTEERHRESSGKHEKGGISKIEMSESLLGDLDSSEGLTARVCVSEMIWRGFIYVL